MLCWLKATNGASTDTFQNSLQNYWQENDWRYEIIIFSLLGETFASGAGPPPFRSFTITLRLATLSRIPINHWWRLYLKTQNTHKRQISIPTMRLKLANTTIERLSTHAFGLATTGNKITYYYFIWQIKPSCLHNIIISASHLNISLYKEPIYFAILPLGPIHIENSFFFPPQVISM